MYSTATFTIVVAKHLFCLICSASCSIITTDLTEENDDEDTREGAAKEGLGFDVYESVRVVKAGAATVLAIFVEVLSIRRALLII